MSFAPSPALPDTADLSAPAAPPALAAWGAVASMSLGVFALVTAEFLPASLLTPLAEGLQISEGLAGQAVTATAFVALLSSLLTAVLARKADRRTILIGFSVLLIASNLIVAAAPGLLTLLFGRVLMGISLGGFWSLSTAMIMRLVPEDRIPRALSVLYLGLSAATVFAVPVGSYLGAIIGWRGVFVAAAGLSGLALLVQLITLPPLPPRGDARSGSLLRVLTRPGIAFSLLAACLTFAGHFSFFTYIRPFLETVTGVGVQGITLILLGFGLASFAGTYLAAFAIRRSLQATLVLVPLFMAVIAAVLVLAGGTTVADGLLISLWGMLFAALPVSWSTWITRAVPDEAEAGGGLIVAGINLAIAGGAGFGGVILEAAGPRAVFLASALILLTAAALILARVRLPRQS